MTELPTRIRVAAESPYDVLVGHDLLEALPAMLGPDVRRVAAIHPTGLPGPTDAVCAALSAAGHDVHAIEVPASEAAKTAEVAAACWRELGRCGWTRSDAVVGIGGGATTDLAGFVAATFLRGLRMVLVPTSLLGMVDAAIGGKTGINTAEGKNLVGSFHEPVGVLCDLAFLADLPRADLASGLAEVVKCGLVADPAILDLVRAHPDRALEPTSAVLRELVERSVRFKAAVVGGDLRERTSTDDAVGREVLNYGHTFGHAVERVEGFQRRHGEAVAIGLAYVAELARLAGRLGADGVATHRELLGSVGLPTSYPGGRWDALRAAMAVDKKARGDRLRFVVLDGIGRPAILEAPDEQLLVDAYAAISD